MTVVTGGGRFADTMACEVTDTMELAAILEEQFPQLDFELVLQVRCTHCPCTFPPPTTHSRVRVLKCVGCKAEEMATSFQEVLRVINQIQKPEPEQP